MHDPLLRRDEQEQHEDSCQPPVDDWRAIDTSDVPPMTAAESQRFLIRLACDIAKRREAREQLAKGLLI